MKKIDKILVWISNKIDEIKARRNRDIEAKELIEDIEWEDRYDIIYKAWIDIHNYIVDPYFNDRNKHRCVNKFNETNHIYYWEHEEVIRYREG